MFEDSSLQFSEDLGDPGFCQGSQAAGDMACSASEQLRPLFDKASEYFIATISRPGPVLEITIAAWLVQSPCHRCAWLRIQAAWSNC
jgi:hypothetical protein